MATHRTHPQDLAVVLEQEWAQLAGSRQLRAALARWAAAHPALVGFGDGGRLRAATEDRRLTHDDRDRILLALAAEAAVDGGDDPLAARVLLQLLLPGVLALQRRLTARTCDPAHREALQAQVLWAVTETIRGYPWRRRPSRVAANILLDTHMRVRRQSRRTVTEVPLEVLDEQTPAAAPDGHRAELLELFLWAVGEGVVSADEVLLIARTDLDEEPVDAVAAALGVARQTVVRRRRRALASLTAAMPQYTAAA